MSKQKNLTEDEEGNSKTLHSGMPVKKGEKFVITYRAMRFVFESDNEIKFYYDSSEKIYDNKTGKIVKDRITVLNINPQADSPAPFTRDFEWEIVDSYRDAEGYVDSKF